MPSHSALEEPSKPHSVTSLQSSMEKSYFKHTDKRESMSSKIINGDSPLQELPPKHVIETKLPEKPKAAPSGVQVQGPRKQWRGMLGASDQLILRMNELLKPSRDLNSILATFNYTLYFAAWLHAKASPIRAKARALFQHKDVNLESPIVSIQVFERTSLASLSRVIRNACRTLRLFSLIPRYVKTRELLKGAKPSQDWTVHKISVVQSFLHGAYEFLESVAFLSEKRILPKGFTSIWTKETDRRAAAAGIYTLAYRVWFLAFSCDILALFWTLHMALHHHNEGAADKDGSVARAKKESHLYTELFFPLAGLPLGWQLSARAEEGFPGFNRNLTFVAGVLEDVRRTITLWSGTRRVEVAGYSGRAEDV